MFVRYYVGLYRFWVFVLRIRRTPRATLTDTRFPYTTLFRSRRSSITVIRAGNRALVLGVTDQSITLLAEEDPDVLVPLAPETPRTASPAEGPSSASPAWTATVEALRDRTARRS